MAKKAPKLNKKYADGGPVTEFSWDDYYKRLDAWKDAKAQAVPQDIVDYESKWIVPQIKQAQTQLNAALAAKYNLQPGQAPNAKQFLTADEAKAVIGDDAYTTYLTNVQGYQAYRDKVAGSYKAPKSTAGAFDPTGEKYGQRHFGLFTPTQAQKDANVATTKAAGKPTSQAEADAIAAQPAKVTKTETAIPQDMTPTGGIMIPPGKEAGTAQPAVQPATTDAQAPAPTPRYDKHVTNFGQTYYFVYDAAGKPQQITQQAYDSGVKSNPNAQQYLLDESTGLYDEQGQPKKPVLTNPAPAPAQEVPVEEKKVTPAPPKMKKGGKVGYGDGGKVDSTKAKEYDSDKIKVYDSLGEGGANWTIVDDPYAFKQHNVYRVNQGVQATRLKYTDSGENVKTTGKASARGSNSGKAKSAAKGYALGGIVPPDTLTGDQLIAFEKLTTDADRQAYLDSIAAGMDEAGQLTGQQKAIAGLSPASVVSPVANLAAAGVDAIDVDPLNKRGTVAQSAASGALRGAGKGAAIGATIGSIVPGVGTVIGAAAGTQIGAIVGGLSGLKKGKKKYEASRSEADASAQQNAIAASYQDSGYKYGGPVGAAALMAGKATRRGADQMPGNGGTHIMLDGYQSPEEMLMMNKRKGLSGGGKVTGAGTGKSDDIAATVAKGSFIVPAENAKMAEMLRKQYLAKDSGKAKLKQGGNTADVYLSNGEHMFTPSEVAVLKKNGIDVDGLAPNSETTGYGYADGGTVSPSKAKKILSDGTIRGKELTPKQKRYFGWIAGKGLKEGGYADGGPVTAQKRQSEINSRLEELDAAEAAEKSSLKQGERFDDKEWYQNIEAEREALKKEQSTLSSQYGSVVEGKEVYLPADYKATAPIYNAKQAAPATETGTGALKHPFEKKTTATTPAVKPGVSGTGGGGGGASAKTEELTPEQTAIQQAFIKEHGGIGSQDPNAATPVATGTQAVATNAIDPLKKRWEELTAAGKVVEAAAIEKQMKEMGYRYQYDNTTKKGDWVSAAGTSTGVTPPATGVNAGMADLEANDATVDTPTGVKPSPYKRIYETLGPGGLLGATQAGIGLVQAQKAKAPTFAGTQVDAGLQARADQAAAASRYGLSAAEYSNAANRIESQRANVMRSLTNAAPGDVGAIVGNARQVAIDTNRSRLDLEAANERMRMAKEQRADTLVGAVAQQRQQLFAQNMGMFNQQQAASAELINAGLANLVGSITSRENQNRIDQRAEKYGNVNLTLAGYGG